uniref:Uncharacterized protein n=1 Tax=Glossina palpalis gambiensis TaxID=67801 RepID=A0A1B0AX81_9MUSC
MKRIIENIVSYRNESSFYFTTKTGVFIKVLSYNRIRDIRTHPLMAISILNYIPTQDSVHKVI